MTKSHTHSRKYKQAYYGKLMRFTYCQSQGPVLTQKNPGYINTHLFIKIYSYSTTKFPDVSKSSAESTSFPYFCALTCQEQGVSLIPADAGFQSTGGRKVCLTEKYLWASGKRTVWKNHGYSSQQRKLPFWSQTQRKSTASWKWEKRKTAGL